MKRFVKVALLLSIFVLLLGTWAYASELKTGIYDLQCAAGVTVTPQTAGGEAISPTTLQIGTATHTFYENAEKFAVSVTGAAADYYVIMVQSNTDTPDADNIRYIDQASPLDGTVSFNAFPDKMLNGTTYYVYLSGGAAGRTQIATFSCYDNSCVVTFEPNGGTGNMEPQAIPADTATALKANTFTRGGYSFTGWNTKADGTGTAYADKANVTLTGDLTLYAQWKENEPLTLKSVTADKTSATVGAPVTWTATATGGTGTLKYCFQVFKDGSKVYDGSYSTSNTFTYTPTEPGSYTAKGYVKDGSGTIKNKTSAAVTVTAASVPSLSVYSVKADKTTATVGQAITWTTVPKGGTGTYKYCFHVYKDDAVILKGSYGTSNTFTYTPTEPGSYTVKGYVKDSNGTIKNKMSGAVTVTNASVPSLSVYSVKADKTTATVGQAITWTTTPKGGTGTYKYCFHVYKDDAVILKGSYGTSSTFTYTPTEPGSYTVKGYVKDSNGTIKNKMSGAVTVTTATVPSLSVYSVKADKTSAVTGEAITWTTVPKGGTGTYKYCFQVFKDGTKIYGGSYGTSNTFTYTPTEPGSYTVKGYVKDSNGTIKNKTSGAVTVTAGDVPLALKSVKANKTTASVGEPITWTATATGGTGTHKFCFHVFKDGVKVQSGSYGSADSVTFTPTEPGSYTVKGYVKDGSGTIKNKTSAAVTVTG